MYKVIGICLLSLLAYVGLAASYAIGMGNYGYGLGGDYGYSGGVGGYSGNAGGVVGGFGSIIYLFIFLIIIQSVFKKDGGFLGRN